MNKEELKRFQAPPLPKPFSAALFPLRDQQQVVSSIMELSANNADAETIEKILSRMSDDLRNNSSFMLDLIHVYPRAYLYVGESLQEDKFVAAAIKRHPNVYFLLPEDLQSQRGMLEKYVDACRHNYQVRCDPDCIGRYYSVEAYASVYEKTLLQGRWAVCGYCDYEPTKSASFVEDAERLNPQMAEQYKQARQEVLQKNADRVCSLVTHNNYFSEYSYWMNEVRRTCPEMEATTIAEYRMKNADALIEQFREGGKHNNFALWLQRDTEAKSEHYPKDFINYVNSGKSPNLAINLNWKIDEHSVYAKIAKPALMQFCGMSEQEAHDLIKNGTYRQVESKIGLIPVISETIRSLGPSMGFSKNTLCQFEKEVLGYEHGRAARNDLASDAHQRSWRERGADWQIDQAVVAALRATRDARLRAGIPAHQTESQESQQLQLNQIKEIEMKADMVFVNAIFSDLEIPIDSLTVAREYDERTDYAEQYPWLDQKSAVDRFVDFVRENESEILQALVDGRLSIEGIAEALGIERPHHSQNIGPNQEPDGIERDDASGLDDIGSQSHTGR